MEEEEEEEEEEWENINVFVALSRLTCQMFAKLQPSLFATGTKYINFSLHTIRSLDIKKVFRGS